MTTTPAQATPVPFVLIAASILCILAGYINVILISVFLQPVSHMTGPLSRLGMVTGSGDTIGAALVLGTVFGFFAGSVASGVIVGNRTVRYGRRYGVVLILEGVLLALATLLLTDAPGYGIPLVALACGLQNGMASNYRGIVLRTTHVTGTITDLGVMIGQLVRHRVIDRWKFWLLGSNIVSFFAGGVLAILAAEPLGAASLWPAAILSVLLGVAYYGWRIRHKFRRRRKPRGV